MKTIHILPKPRSVEWGEGSFQLNRDTVILLDRAAPEDALRTAFGFQQFVRQTLGLTLGVYRLWNIERETNAVCFTLAPSDTETSSESYVLSIAPERIQLKAAAPIGLLWAERTLRQIIAQTGRNAPSVLIDDSPRLRYRGVMLDISRSKVPTLDTLFGIVDHLSFYKLNVFQLYIEHTFAFRHHPLIGKGCAPLTSEDILRLDAHCRSVGIELIPSLQSFGHMHHILKLAPYRHLAETERLWTITPAKEETYQLLEEMFDDFLPSFSSGFCSINCDETWDLGQGLSKAEADRIGVGRVYLNHILRLHNIVTGKHGRRMMMWGDIILNHPELISELPKDIIVLNWGYDRNHSFHTAKTFADSGLVHWVCPGTSSWNTIFPRVNNACANISSFVKVGLEHGAAGMLNTDWGDGGHYNLQGLSWHGYLYGAELAWSGAGRAEREFDAAFGRLFFGKGGGEIARAVRQLGTANDNPDMYLPNSSRSSYMLFDHPDPSKADDLLAPLTPATLRRVERAARSASRTFAAAARQQRGRTPEQLQTLRECHLAADLLAFAARKTLFLKSLGVGGHPGRGGTATPTKRDTVALRRLVKEQRTLVERFKSLWLTRSRPEGIEEALGRFAAEERYLLSLCSAKPAR